MGKIKAVLFDMDGLMIDSEPLHFLAYQKVFSKYGKNFTVEENTKRYIGISDVDCAKDMVVRFNLPIPAEQLLEEKRQVYKEIIKNQLVAQPGLSKLLTSLLKNDYKIAIASSSTLEDIKAVIKGLNISSQIDEYASSEEVKNGKPAPDVYLLAAKKLKVKPSDCLVLEDTPRGAQAGKSAGMKVFAIPSQYTKDWDFSLADKVLNSLSEVFGLINL